MSMIRFTLIATVASLAACDSGESAVCGSNTDCDGAATCQNGACVDPVASDVAAADVVGNDVVTDTAAGDDAQDAVSDTGGDDSGGGDTVVVVTPCDGLNDGDMCDDGDACTVDTTCQGGVCQGGTPLSCKSNDPCKASMCSPTLGCVETAAGDGKDCTLPCYTAASCQSGVCVGDTAMACPAPTGPCVDNLLCDPSSGLCTMEVFKTAGAACDSDSNACSVEECAANGSCTSTGNLPDGDVCGPDRICTSGSCGVDPCANGGCSTVTCPVFTAGFAAPDDIRNGPVTLVAGASIHVLGGSPSKQHFVYSPGSGWLTGTALTDGVGEGAGVTIGTKWYLVDGDPDEGVRIYDLVQGAWSLGAVRPGVYVRGPAAGTDGSVMYVAGGGDGNLNGGDATYRYHPGDNAWTTMAPMPTARGFVAHATVGDRLYVIGGRDKALSGSTIIRATEAYDMGTNTWYQLEDMPTKRNSAFAAAVGDHIVVAGGFSGSTQLDVIEIYDTVNDTWTECDTSMGSAFSGGAAASLNGKLYLFGGGVDELGVEVGTF